MAQRTASTMLRNSTRTPSPVRFTTRPLWTEIAGSTKSLRRARSLANVRSSSKEQPVSYCQLRPCGYPLTQHTQLMPQQHDLGFQPRLRLERRDKDMEEQDQEPDHAHQPT